MIVTGMARPGVVTIIVGSMVSRRAGRTVAQLPLCPCRHALGRVCGAAVSRATASRLPPAGCTRMHLLLPEARIFPVDDALVTSGHDVPLETARSDHRFTVASMTSRRAPIMKPPGAGPSQLHRRLDDQAADGPDGGRVGTVPYLALGAAGPRRPRFTGGVPAADLSSWG